MTLAIIGVVLLVGSGVCLYFAGVPAAVATAIVAAVSTFAEVLKKAFPKKDGDA